MLRFGSNRATHLKSPKKDQTCLLNLANDLCVCLWRQKELKWREDHGGLDLQGPSDHLLLPEKLVISDIKRAARRMRGAVVTMASPWRD